MRRGDAQHGGPEQAGRRRRREHRDEREVPAEQERSRRAARPLVEPEEHAAERPEEERGARDDDERPAPTTAYRRRRRDRGGRPRPRRAGSRRAAALRAGTPWAGGTDPRSTPSRAPRSRASRARSCTPRRGTTKGKTPSPRSPSASPGGHQLEREDVAGEADGVLAAGHREREESRRQRGVAEPAVVAPSQVGVERGDAEGDRHERLAVGEPSDGKHVARREGEDDRRDRGNARREQAPVERACREHGGDPPEQRVDVQRQGRAAEEVVVGPQQRAREWAGRSEPGGSAPPTTAGCRARRGRRGPRR